MRLLRGLAAIPIFLIATVLLVVAFLLCVTVLLLPLGVPLGFVALGLYAKGISLLLSRPKKAKHGLLSKKAKHGLRPKKTKHRLRKIVGSKTKGPANRVKSVRKGARARVRKVRKAVHV
jgi:hypothetical protein